MYRVCIESNECGFVEYTPTSVDVEPCPICLSPVLEFSDNFWLDEKSHCLKSKEELLEALPRRLLQTLIKG